MSDCTEIIGNLWMGGEIAPTFPVGFAAVVDCRILEDLKIWDFQHNALLWIPFIDEDKLPPSWMIDMGVAFVQTAIANGLKTLVHCSEGHNRSGLIVGSYLTRCCLGGPITPTQAIGLIRAKRPGALSNQTFVNFLMKGPTQ